MKRVRFDSKFVFVAALFVVACTRQDPRTSPETAGVVESRDVKAAIHAVLSTELIFPPNADLATLERTLGKVETSTSRFINIDGTDPTVFPGTERGTLQLLNFRGLVIELYKSEVDGRSLIKTVDLTADNWGFPKSVRIGSTQGEVKSVLGEPLGDSTSDVYIYQIHEAYLREVRFFFASGKVVRVRWDFEV